MTPKNDYNDWFEQEFSFRGTTKEEREMISLYGEEALIGTPVMNVASMIAPDDNRLTQPSEAVLTASEGLRYMKAARLMTMDGYFALVNRLKVMNFAYYQQGEPMVTDTEFDCLKLQAEAVENLHPDWTLPDSPTQTVGSDVVTGLKKIAHRTPMLSLQKADGKTDELKREKLARWFRSVAEGLDVVCEYKYDGNSVSLVYQDGQFIEASTRGENGGLVGSDITAQMRHLVPQRIEATGRCEVRGELLIPNDAYDRLPSYDKAKTQQAQIRKVLQQVSRPSLAQEQGFEFVAWEVCSVCSDSITASKSHAARMAWARAQGFTTSEPVAVRTLTDIERTIAQMEAGRETMAYPTDGVVVKLDADDDRLYYGETAHHPKWALAWKYATTFATVEVTSVGTSRTGKPVLYFEPLMLNGCEFCKVDVRDGDLQQFPFRRGDRIRVAVKPGSSSIQFVAIVADDESTESAQASSDDQSAPRVGGDAQTQNCDEREGCENGSTETDVLEEEQGEQEIQQVDQEINPVEDVDVVIPQQEIDHFAMTDADREARADFFRRMKEKRQREKELCSRIANARQEQAEDRRDDENQAPTATTSRRYSWLKAVGLMAASVAALVAIYETGLLIPLGLIGLATSGIIK